MSLDDLATTSPRSAEPTTTTYRPAKRSRTWILPVLLLLGFASIFWLLFGGRLTPATKVQTSPVITIRAGEPAPSKTQKNAATADEIIKGTLLFQASGWIEPAPYTIYVPALVNGVLDKVLVLEGQAVKKGETLATLINENAKFKLQEATQNHSAMITRIQAHCGGIDIINAETEAAKLKIRGLELQVEESEDHYTRLKKLSTGSISKQQVVKARLANERAEANLNQARAELPKLSARLQQIDAEKSSMEASLAMLATKRDIAQLALDRTVISAPMDGIVLQLHAAPGRKRMLDMDDPNSAVIVELYDPKQLQARIDVPLNEAAALTVGQIVEMSSDLLPDKIFTGLVTNINGKADLQRNTLQAKVSITDPDPRLRPEMLVRAKFYKTSNQPKAKAGAPQTDNSKRLNLYVSEKALVSSTQVWIVSKDNTAEIRRIKLSSEARDAHRLVIDGLRSGESVILPPFEKLKPGMRITPETATH